MDEKTPWCSRGAPRGLETAACASSMCEASLVASTIAMLVGLQPEAKDSLACDARTTTATSDYVALVRLRAVDTETR